MKKVLTLLLAVVPLVAMAQEKVVEKSAKRAPEWIGLSAPGYIITSSEGATLDEARGGCLSNIRQIIASSVAVNISSSEAFSETITTQNDGVDKDRRYSTEIESIAASLPYVTNILIDDAEIYWQKIYNKKSKQYHYEVHAKYPFSDFTRGKLISEFMEQDKSQYDRYLALKEQYFTFTEAEFIERAIGELHTLRKYFFDAKRQNEVDALTADYRSLYSSISIVPFSEKLGEIVYYLELGGRRITCHKKGVAKSDYATSIQFFNMENGMTKITYNYDYSLPEDENVIKVSIRIGSYTVKHNFFFTPPTK